MVFLSAKSGASSIVKIGNTYKELMMPIRNFTDTIQPRFPRLGKLRKGGERVEKTNDKGQKYLTYGEDLDHFRFTSDRPEIIEAFQDAYGETPRTIQVYLPYASPEEAFPTWCELWSTSGLQHRCDGELMVQWLENGKYVRGSKPCAGGHEKGDPLNDAIGRLDMVIPELIEAGFVGYVTLETHSKNDIIAILSTLRAVYESRQGNELGLRGIMFNLRRVQETISVPGYGKQEGKRSRANKWLIKLEPAADWVRLQIEMAHASQMELGPGEKLIALPSGEKADVVTGEIVDQDPEWVEPTEQKPAAAAEPQQKTEPKPEQPKTNGKAEMPKAQPPKAKANGNGSKPVVTMSDAAVMKTPKGTFFFDLNDEQLAAVIKALEGKPGQEKFVAGAQFFASQELAGTDVINEWIDIGAQAEALQVDVMAYDKLLDGADLGKYRRIMAKVLVMSAAAEKANALGGEQIS
jgi:hypothetical protein